MLSIYRRRINTLHCISYSRQERATQVIKQTRPQEPNRGGLSNTASGALHKCSRFRETSPFVLLRLVSAARQVPRN